MLVLDVYQLRSTYTCSKYHGPIVHIALATQGKRNEAWVHMFHFISTRQIYRIMGAGGGPQYDRSLNRFYGVF